MEKGIMAPHAKYISHPCDTSLRSTAAVLDLPLARLIYTANALRSLWVSDTWRGPSRQLSPMAHMKGTILPVSIDGTEHDAPASTHEPSS
mmetsp:Transcript_15551/g.29978  ORF Transcript_15551/g.29978 Transcript_15551/m.29978 type:complete len:90 (-) Transcript_15551:1260-1529(-)